MNIALLAACALMLGGVAILVEHRMYRRHRRGGLAPRLRRTLVVHTKDGRSFRGVLVVEYADSIVLAHAEILDEKVMKLGGEVVVMLANLSWAQDVTGIPKADDKFQLDKGAP